jgi:predicted dienelactone hydrolase
VADLKFVHAELAARNQPTNPSLLSGLLDMEQLGVLGHSTGGGTMIEYALGQPHCRAVLAMDAWMEPLNRDVLTTDLARPLMLLHSEVWAMESLGRNYQFLDQFISHSSAPVWQATIRGTRHLDFSVMPIFSPIAHKMNLSGPLDGPHTLEIINAYTLAFFKHTMQGQPQALLNGAKATFPDVIFGEHPATSDS